jgi:hypothetical protein
MSFSAVDIQAVMLEGDVLWKKHALERMMERGISRARVKKAMFDGNIIENYPDDYPLPSFLICDINPEPLHVVASYDDSNKLLYIISVYTPDFNHFENDHITRRKL